MKNQKQQTDVLTAHGFQAWLARRAKLPRVTVHLIYHGKRRATPPQAAALEPLLVERGIPLNRWDLIYGVQKGQSLPEYLAGKVNAQKED